MRLIFKVDQPLFFFVIHLDRHDNTAGIDLIRLLLIRQFSLSLQTPHSHQGKIHQAHELVLSSGKYLAVVIQILPVSIHDRIPVITFIEDHIFQLS